MEKRRLKRQTIDVNIKSGRDHDCSPLMRATQKATTARRFTIQHDIIKLLLQQQGVDVSQADSRGNTPLSIACYSGDIDVVRLLLEHDTSLLNNYSNRNSLMLACCDSTPCIICFTIPKLPHTLTLLTSLA